MTLTEAMSEVDRQVFQCDVRLIDWPNYLHAYALGIRQFILKEDIFETDQPELVASHGDALEAPTKSEFSNCPLTGSLGSP